MFACSLTAQAFIVVLASPVLAGVLDQPWSVSVSAGLAYVPQPPWGQRIREAGLGAGVMRHIDERIAVGVECAWWEEMTRRSFVYSTDLRDQPSEERDRDLAAGVLMTVEKRLGRFRPVILAGAGCYWTSHWQAIGARRRWTSPEYSPGFSLGAALESAGAATPTVCIRWHRLARSGHGYDPDFGRDRLELSVGGHFAPARDN